MNIKRQDGMTGIGWLLVLGLIGFFALSAIRVVPIYIEGIKVKNALEALQKVPNITRKSNAEIVSTLFKTFSVDDVKNVTREDITISKDNGRLTVEVEYESRGPYMGNLEIVASFHEKVEIIQN